MASYIAFGARSAPFGHSIAPSTTRACAKIAGSRSGSKIVFSILGSLRNDRSHIDIPGHPIHKSHAQPRIRQSGHGRYTPRNGMPYRRFYFRGSIAFGVFSWLHRFQFSISSSRCSVAHSNTNAIARSGKEPRMSRKSRSSISASCSAYRAWKCGGA